MTAILFVISGFCREVDENCALPGHYAASSGNLLSKFRDILSVPSSGVKNLKGTAEEGTGRLPQNASNKLPLLAE